MSFLRNHTRSRMDTFFFFSVDQLFPEKLDTAGLSSVMVAFL